MPILRLIVRMLWSFLALFQGILIHLVYQLYLNLYEFFQSNNLVSIFCCKDLTSGFPDNLVTLYLSLLLLLFSFCIIELSSGLEMVSLLFLLHSMKIGLLSMKIGTRSEESMPEAGFEPATFRLWVERSNQAEPLRQAQQRYFPVILIVIYILLILSPSKDILSTSAYLQLIIKIIIN